MIFPFSESPNIITLGYVASKSISLSSRNVNPLLPNPFGTLTTSYPCSRTPASTKERQSISPSVIISVCESSCKFCNPKKQGLPFTSFSFGCILPLLSASGYKFLYFAYVTVVPSLSTNGISIYLSALSGSGLLTILYSLQVSSDIPLSSIYSLHAPVSSKPLIWLISYVSDFFSSCLFCLFSTLIFLSSPFMFSILFVFVTPLLIIFAFASKLLSMFAPCCISGVNNPASLIDIIACKRLNVPPAPHLLPLKHLNLPVSALT